MVHSEEFSVDVFSGNNKDTIDDFLEQVTHLKLHGWLKKTITN